jgi:hypothetical protein
LRINRFDSLLSCVHPRLHTSTLENYNTVL